MQVRFVIVVVALVVSNLFWLVNAVGRGVPVTYREERQARLDEDLHLLNDILDASALRLDEAAIRRGIDAIPDEDEPFEKCGHLNVGGGLGFRFEDGAVAEIAHTVGIGAAHPMPPCPDGGG